MPKRPTKVPTIAAFTTRGPWWLPPGESARVLGVAYLSLIAQQRKGKLYYYGASDQRYAAEFSDCSMEFAIQSRRAGTFGHNEQRPNVDGLYARTDAATSRILGAPEFYGTGLAGKVGDPQHVVIVIDPARDTIVGANGGDSSVKGDDNDARVKVQNGYWTSARMAPRLPLWTITMQDALISCGMDMIDAQRDKVNRAVWMTVLGWKAASLIQAGVMSAVPEQWETAVARLDFATVYGVS